MDDVHQNIQALDAALVALNTDGELTHAITRLRDIETFIAGAELRTEQRKEHAEKLRREIAEKSAALTMVEG